MEQRAEDNQIVLCDFEYSSYGYRGQDFGTIITEWGRTMNDFKELHKFPEDSVIETLIEIYIKESEKIFGKKYSENPLNCVQQILKEVKVFTLSGSLFIILWFLKDDEDLKEAFPMDKKVSMVWLFNVFFFLKIIISKPF